MEWWTGLTEKENLLDAQYSPLFPPSSRKYSGEPQLERSGRSELPPLPCHTFSNETPHIKVHLTDLWPGWSTNSKYILLQSRWWQNWLTRWLSLVNLVWIHLTSAERLFTPTDRLWQRHWRSSSQQSQREEKKKTVFDDTLFSAIKT